MSFDDMIAAMAKVQEKATPPQYILCGIERYKALLRESGVDPDTPEGWHTLNEAKKKAALSTPIGNAIPATCYFGVRVVVSDLIDPDFFQVLPDPAFVLK